jgi:hypothetical protein
MTVTSGTRSACAHTMRALLALVLLGGCLGGCFGGGSGGAVRPAVIPMLSELPGDPNKRDAVLDQANTTAGPEHRKGMTSKERKAETAAATAAAILGGIFSKHANVTIGTASQFDENHIIAPEAVPRVQPAGTADDAAKPGEAKPDPAKPDAAPPSTESNTDLIPWIRLK